MTRSSLGLWLGLGSVFALACDGREITVFEAPAKVGGAGSGGGGSSPGGSSASGMSSAGAQHVDAGSGGSSGGSVSSAGGGSVSEGGGGISYGGKPPGKPCVDKFDCDPGWSCEKISCDAASGFCEPIQLTECSPIPEPVCGCDGVTYWNDCLRRQFGAQFGSLGECRATACTCEIGADCEVPYASCSHVLPNTDMCGHGMGACWVLPQICYPAPPGARKWRQCLGPDQPLGPCVDTCDAIASEHTHIQAHRDDPCQL